MQVLMQLADLGIASKKKGGSSGILKHVGGS
jgi:hypothetical protein